MTPGKTITWKKEKGKQYHLACNIEAVGKNNKWAKKKKTEIWGKKIKIQ